MFPKALPIISALSKFKKKPAQSWALWARQKLLRRLLPIFALTKLCAYFQMKKKKSSLLLTDSRKNA
jgi:hypothetical protein